MPAKKIYIADDDQNIREAIQAFLANEGYAVTAFETGDLLLRAFNDNPCDLVILDIMMPGSNGFTICTEIRKISTVPVIMLTARDSDLDYATGMSLGSDDYFTKPFSAISLIMRVKSIFRRISYERQNNGTGSESETVDVLIFGDINVDEKKMAVTVQGNDARLTPNEYGLLLHLIKKQEQAVSRDELLREVWGFETDIETRAVDDTVRRLRKKLQVSNVEIEAVWGFGFRLKVK